MSEQAIGVFDSGLGGLTAVKELIKVLPQENIIYFGDTARVPYGNRSEVTINRYARQDANFLLSKGVKLIIAACGTVSSVAAGLPEYLPVPFTGVVAPTAAAAVSSTRNGKIGIIGTSATVNSGSYKKEILRRNDRITVYQQDCPLFVSLVENGFISENDEIVKLVVERYLSEMKHNNIDTLILGCTHFPIIAKAISNFLGNHVRLIDSGRETALFAANILGSSGLLNTSNHIGQCSYFVSDTVESFRKTAEIFLGKSVEDEVAHINIEQVAVQ
ncbi:MAG: glutamate racemase [Clostridia bacterium]|nr:glutamate racemase [Clostridia bacterium]